MTTRITMLRGDLLRDDADALVNTVNCVGVMGKGIALTFKRRYPAMFDAYRRRCASGAVRTGTMHVWANPAHPEHRITEEPVELVRSTAPANPRLVVNFPTKQHWRDPSKIEWIIEGLVDLTLAVQAHQISSIAIPPLGCGNGGLRWSDVEPLILAAVATWPEDVEVRIYQP